MHTFSSDPLQLLILQIKCLVVLSAEQSDLVLFRIIWFTYFSYSAYSSPQQRYIIMLIGWVAVYSAACKALRVRVFLFCVVFLACFVYDIHSAEYDDD